MRRAPCPDFETDRLVVRDWTASISSADTRRVLTQALAGILTETVLRFLPEPVQLSSDSETALSDWIDQRQTNATVYTVSNKNGVLIGLLTLAEPEHLDLRLGYLLGEAHWGKGFATELIQGFLNALPDQPGRIIHGGVDPDNAGSARVLLKSGFTQDTSQSSTGVQMFTLRG